MMRRASSMPPLYGDPRCIHPPKPQFPSRSDLGASAPSARSLQSGAKTGYVVFGPALHTGTHWRLVYQILNYCGQQIEICDAGKAKYLDTQNNIWIKRDIDFTKAETIGIFGISTKVIPKDDLLEYKSRTYREVDIIDIEQIKDNE